MHIPSRWMEWMLPALQPRLLPAATLLLALGLTPAAPQTAPDMPTAPGIQRERVSLVLIDVVVTDRSGLPVKDLRPEDFTLFVDGRPVKIQSVDLQTADAAAATPGETPGPPTPKPEGPSLPTATPGPPPPPAPPTGPPDAAQPISGGRGIVLFFDGLNSRRGLGEEAIHSARRFLQEGLSPGDEVMVVGLGRQFKVYQDFTPDMAAALSALDRVETDPQIRQGGEDKMVSNLLLQKEMRSFFIGAAGGGRLTMASLGEAFASDDVRRMERFFSVLAALTGVLRTREGRKEVFLFSDGFAINPEAIYSTLHPRRRTDDLLRTTREASAGRVVLNPVSTLGLTAPAPWSGLAALFTRTLSALALNTGGVLVHGVNNHLEAPMRKIEEQSRVTYQLAYAPDGEPDGKLHSTQVVVRRKELEVRAQEGYLWMTEAQRRERETISAYAAPEMFRAIPVSLLVRAYLEDDGKPMVEVAIALSESSLLLLPREGRRTAHLEAGGLLRSTDGKVEKRFSRNVKARLPRKEDTGTRDLTLLARQSVPPGEYEAVVVVRDLDSGEVGAAQMPVKVPALSPGHLAMSSLVLSRPGSASGRIDLDRPGSGERLLEVPAVTPVFTADETVSASSVLYHPRRDPASHEASIILLAAIHGPGAADRTLLSMRHRIPARDTRDSFPIDFPLDLTGLEPGLYELRLQAWDEVDNRGVLQKVEFLLR